MQQKSLKVIELNCSKDHALFKVKNRPDILEKERGRGGGGKWGERGEKEKEVNSKNKVGLNLLNQDLLYSHCN